MSSSNAWCETTESCQSPAWAEALTEWIELDAHPRFIISAALVCLWMNRAARKMLGDDPPDPGDRTPRPLTFFDPEGLKALIGEASDSVAHWRCLSTRTGERKVVWARGIEGSPPTLFGLVLLLPDKLDFSAYYDSARLTPAEARIIESILQGESSARVALDFRVSKETLKTHLRNAYRKLGVGSRGELFREARKFLAP